MNNNKVLNMIRSFKTITKDLGQKKYNDIHLDIDPFEEEDWMGL